MNALPQSRGFSVLELLATVGLVGILSSVTLAVFTGTNERARGVKLSSDIAALNRSTKAYRTQGGDLSTVTNAHQVLSKLKTVADAPSRLKFPGFRGSYVDYRLVAVDADPLTTGPRAVWNQTKQRFELAQSGAGVNEFVNQKEATADAGIEEARGGQSMELATQSAWVWDFEDAPPIAANTASAIGVSDGENAQTGTYQSPSVLDPPIFSHPGGVFGAVDFALLTTTLENPPSNPLGTLIRYSINDSAWQIYDGTPIVVAPDSQIVAYALSSDPDTTFSSYTRTEAYRLSSQNFAGQSAGEFYDAAGPDMENMVTNYVTNGVDGSFEWGEGADGYTTGSTLGFTANSFSDVAADSLFMLGTLEFFNSTITLASQATSVWLALDLNLTTPGIMETFNYEFTLENTENLEGNTADENADFVRIDNPSNSFSTMLNGQVYDFDLQFGYTGDDGFSTLDSFHVHEGASAQAELWGSFTLAEDLPETP